MQKKNRKRWIWAFAIALVALILPGFYNGMKVVTYRVPSKAIRQPVRIALITDLHSCAYGDKQEHLLNALDRQKPDLILLGGDLFDEGRPDERALTVLEWIGNRYPCYYVTGNHEYLSEKEVFDRRMAELEACGVKRLSGEKCSLEVRGQRVDLAGVDDPRAWFTQGRFTEHEIGSYEAQVAGVGAQKDPGACTILLAHRPEYLDLYGQYGFDIILAGHTHGGQWRIPGLLNGLFAPNQGWFPVYAGGEYVKGDVRMIISRGLARESTRIPRFYNRPELVIVELSGA